MTTQVLYQKWRPQRFADVVGQGPVIQTLHQAVALGRVAHAYLFSGPRGTGKTSTARILAKALNCQSLAPNATTAEKREGDPDNSCPFCLAVNMERFLDLIEMDAASHRGIDDVRSLRERVFGSGPGEGRCKVYIIDEVHMLTEPAFNALLKTLEEPAPWAYFILCTTEPHKVPATIISRCQRFDFRRVTVTDIAERLETICQDEEAVYEPEALRAIARASWGSLRDACNILEQAIISSGARVTLAQVEVQLGLSRDAKALELVRHTLAGDISRGLGVINGVATAGADLRVFHRDVVEFLRAVLLLKSGVGEGLDYPIAVLEEIRAVADKVSWEGLFRAVRLFGRANPRPGDALSTLPLELVLVEWAEGGRELQAASSQDVEATEPLARPRVSASTPAVTPGSVPVTMTKSPTEPEAPAPPLKVASHQEDATPSVRLSVPEAIPAADKVPMVEEAREEVLVEANSHDTAEAAAPETPASSVLDSQWDALCGALKRVRGNKFVLGSLLLDCRERYITDDSLVLVFRNGANRDRLEEELQHPPSHQAIQEAVRTALGRDYALELALAENHEAERQPQGHLVRAAMAMGAKIVEEREETP